MPTILEKLRDAALRHASAVALRSLAPATLASIDVTYAELWQRAAELSAGLQALGIGRGERVLLFGDNGPEILLAAIATMACRALAVPLYPNFTAAQVRAIARHAAPRVAFVQAGPQLARFIDGLRDLAERPRVISFGDGVPGPGNEIRSVLQVSADGRRRIERTPRLFEDLVAATRFPDEVAIVYGSGDGAPKGAVVRHEHALAHPLDAIFFPRAKSGGASEQPSSSSGERRAAGLLGPRPSIGPGDVGLLHLPLANTFGLFCAAFGLLFAGATVAFPTTGVPPLEAIGALRPTLAFAGPNVLRTLEHLVLEDIARGSGLARRALEWAYGLGRRAREGHALSGRVRDLLLRKRIHARFGGRLRLAYVTAGADPRAVQLFRDAALPLYEGYGVAEMTPLIALNQPDLPGERRSKRGTLGRPVAGISVRIVDSEIVVRGGTLASRYWLDERARDLRDEDGWFHTGDLGSIDEEGFIVFEDRKRDLLRLTSGAVVSPRPIEERMRRSRLIDQAVLIGRDRPHVVALVVPDFPALARAAEARGLGRLSRADMLSSREVLAIVEEEVARCLAGVPEVARPKRVRLLSMPFSEAGGELSPIHALKRVTIEEKYKLQIEALYTAPAPARAAATTA